MDEPFDNMKARADKAPYEYTKDFEDDFKWLMSSQRGRRIVHWLLSGARVFCTTFEETPARAAYMPLAMAHAEGKKDMGYRLLAKIGAVCPEQYGKMMKENTDA